jgi:hypothetical protein
MFKFEQKVIMVKSLKRKVSEHLFKNRIGKKQKVNSQIPPHLSICSIIQFRFAKNTCYARSDYCVERDTIRGKGNVFFC